MKKYLGRLRAGFKDQAQKDLDKSNVYRDWLFELGE